MNSPAPQPAAAPMAVDLLSFTPKIQGALRGFAKVRLRGGLIIHDVSILFSNERAWASLPSKPQIGAGGVVLKDNAGKTRYVPVIKWENKADRQRWSDGVVAAVERAHGPIAAMTSANAMLGA